MLKDDAYIGFCKIGGPFVLFLCTPTVAVILYRVRCRDLAQGIPITFKNDIEAAVIVSLIGWMGFYTCRKAWGWFGGRKWEE